MSAMRVEFGEPDRVEITDPGSDLRWTFHIVADRAGRLHLDGPHGPVEAMVQGDLMQRACVFAQSEALHAGKVDY